MSIESIKKAAFGLAALCACSLGGCVTVQESPLPVSAPEQGAAPVSVPTDADSLHVAKSPILLNPETAGVHQVCADIGGPITIYYATDKGGWRDTNYYSAQVFNETPGEAYGETSVNVTVRVPGRFIAVAHYTKRPYDLAPRLIGIDSEQATFNTLAPSGEQIMLATRPIAEIAGQDASNRSLTGRCTDAIRRLMYTFP